VLNGRANTASTGPTLLPPPAFGTGRLTLSGAPLVPGSGRPTVLWARLHRTENHEMPPRVYFGPPGGDLAENRCGEKYSTS